MTTGARQPWRGETRQTSHGEGGRARQASEAMARRAGRVKLDMPWRGWQGETSETSHGEEGRARQARQAMARKAGRDKPWRGRQGEAS